MSLGWYSQLYTFCTFRMYILPRKLNVPLREPFLVTFILKGIYFVPFNVYVLPAQMHKVHLVRVKSSLNNKHQRPFQFFKDTLQSRYRVKTQRITHYRYKRCTDVSSTPV